MCVCGCVLSTDMNWNNDGGKMTEVKTVTSQSISCFFILSGLSFRPGCLMLTRRCVIRELNYTAVTP